MNTLVATIPHAGEEIPDFCHWLKSLPEPVLMCDVDRFVDKLYIDVLNQLKIPWIATRWHRYAADLNRDPGECDRDSVDGNPNASGLHNRGFHWTITTTGIQLMKSPMSADSHNKLVDLIHTPFHEEIARAIASEKNKGRTRIFHLDLHSMPSIGTNQHRDPGERRADIVISDQNGTSANMMFVDLAIASFVKAGFKVGYNWPYLGGKITQIYGNPIKGHNTLQVEINRSLYMDEVCKHLLTENAQKTIKKLEQAMRMIHSGIMK